MAQKTPHAITPAINTYVRIVNVKKWMLVRNQQAQMYYFCHFKCKEDNNFEKVILEGMVAGHHGREKPAAS